MKKNVGGKERTVRILLGFVFVIAMILVLLFGEELGTTMQGGVAIILLVGAFITLGTAGARTCPVNTIVGRDTYEGEN